MKNSKAIIYLSSLIGAFILLIAAAAVIDGVMHAAPAPPAAAKAVDQPTNIKTGNRIGDVAPDFTLTTTDGRQISLSDYRGKNVILNFWATWCGPCRYEISSIESIHEQWSEDNVVVLAVASQDELDTARTYAKIYKLKFTIPVDGRGETMALYGIHGIPTTFFINRDGVITSIKVGPFFNDEEIVQRMSSFN